MILVDLALNMLYPMLCICLVYLAILLIFMLKIHSKHDEKAKKE